MPKAHRPQDHPDHRRRPDRDRRGLRFDSSGAWACKALRLKGYRVVLVNSNPATIMTDPEMADAVYVEPSNWQTVRRSSRRNAPTRCCRPWAGRPALNCGSIADHGVLEKYGVELIGAKREAICMAGTASCSGGDEGDRAGMPEGRSRAPRVAGGSARHPDPSASRPSSAHFTSAAAAAASPTTAKS